MAGSTQFLHIALLSTDECCNILRCVQHLLADQLRLLADGVQTAAVLPQFRGKGTTLLSFGQEAQAVAVVEIKTWKPPILLTPLREPSRRRCLGLMGLIH